MSTCEKPKRIRNNSRSGFARARFGGQQTSTRTRNGDQKTRRGTKHESTFRPWISQNSSGARFGARLPKRMRRGEASKPARGHGMVGGTFRRSTNQNGLRGIFRRPAKQQGDAERRPENPNGHQAGGTFRHSTNQNELGCIVARPPFWWHNHEIGTQRPFG